MITLKVTKEMIQSLQDLAITKSMEGMETISYRSSSMQTAPITMISTEVLAMITCKEQAVQTTFMEERVMISSRVVTETMRSGEERVMIPSEEAWYKEGP